MSHTQIEPPTTLDWTLPIVIAATDWQEELPARVVKAVDSYVWSLIAIDAPHRLYPNGWNFEAGESWLFDQDGICDDYPDIRVINKGTGDE